MELWHIRRGLILPGPGRRLCSTLGVTHLIGFGASTSGGTTWVNTYSVTMTGAQGGRANYNYRNWYSAGLLSQSATAGKTRITFTNASGGGNHTIDSCYIGHAAGAGDAYDFDGAQVQVLVGASGSFSVLTASDVVSDEINFSLDETKNVIVSLHINSGFSSNGTYKAADANQVGYSKSGSDESSTTNVSSYSADNGPVYIKKIEVFQ